MDQTRSKGRRVWQEIGQWSLKKSPDQCLGNWAPILAHYGHSVEQIPSLCKSGYVGQHLSLHKSVGKSLHSGPQGPLTWQTWVGSPVDSGWQVEAAIRKACDDSAWSFRCLQRVRPSMLRSY